MKDADLLSNDALHFDFTWKILLGSVYTSVHGKSIICYTLSDYEMDIHLWCQLLGDE